MPPPSPVDLTDEGFVILAQVFVAFGQGADGLLISPSVILAARRDYSGPIEGAKKNWDSDGPQTLAITKAMGKLAAHFAMAEGQITIDVKHYRSARRTIHLKAFCPFFHRPPG